MPLQIHAGEVLLPQRLIHRDCRRVGKIQRADVPQHGNAHAGVRMLPQEPFGKSRSLLAEHQHTLRRIPHLGIAARRFGREKEKLSVCVLFEEFGEIFIVKNLQLIPIIKTGAFQMPVGDLEAEGLHQMQGAAGGGAGTCDIAGILGNLRLYENDMEAGRFPAR